MFLMEWGSFVASIDMYCIHCNICMHTWNVAYHRYANPYFWVDHVSYLLKFIHPKLSCKSSLPKSTGSCPRVIGLRGSNPMNIRHIWLLRIISPLDIFHFAVWVLSPSARIFVSIHGTEICRCAKWLSSYWQGGEIKGDGNWMQLACSAHKLLILSSTFCI